MMIGLEHKKYRLTVLLFTSIAIIATLIMSFFVETNYDMTKYLDQNSNTYQGIEILEQTFGNHSGIELMVDGLSLSQTVALKNQINDLPYVVGVVFIDDYIDINTPLEFIPDELKNVFISNQYHKLQIQFELDSYDVRLESTVASIRSLSSGAIRGDLLGNIEARRVANDQMILIMLIILPICILILGVASKSIVEVLLILITLGIGIVLNTGTNILLNDISFITMTMAMALQLAMSLDYSLMLVHRYHEYQDLGRLEAVKKSLRASLKPITASGFTTVFGFIALMFMQYRIGFDMGFVLAKGILFSYLTVIIVLPILLYYADPLIKKTTYHKVLPNVDFIGKTLYKIRLPLLISFVILSIVGFYFSQQSPYMYAGTQLEKGSTLYLENEQIEAQFGKSNTLVILFKGEDVDREVMLAQSLLSHPNILRIDSLVTSVDPTIPRSFLPETLVSNFIQNGYSRFILYTDLTEESDAFFELDQYIRDQTFSFFDEAYFLGTMSSTADIKEMVLADTMIVLVLSIGLVFIVLLLVFKSILKPIILILVIEAAIWFNFAFNGVFETPVMYIGYLIIMSIQLGATIDYGVLLTSRYQENLETLSKKEAYIMAINQSLPTIIVSSLILSAAGFIEFFVSDMSAIKEIGLLLGRGALIALLSIILFVPPLLDTFIKKKGN